MKPLFPIDMHFSALDEAIYKSPFGVPYVCNVCGKLTRTRIWPAIVSSPEIELRENLRCTKCGGKNRNRQIASVLCRRLKVRSLAEIPALRAEHAIFNTESNGAVHDALKSGKNYIASEYLGDHASGTIVGGVVHQDIAKTSFDDDRFDVVLTSDVLEHVPEPLVAFREIHRILKPGGSHVFTVPFYQDRAANELRARVSSAGEIEHLMEPCYHIDPIRPEGVLVYNVFALELLSDLERIGFETSLYKLHDVAHGILGQNAIVFESLKRGAPPSA